MNSDVIYEMIKVCLAQGFVVAAPIVFTALVVGILVSVFQTVTSIQEATLSFVPKVLICGVVFWLLAPWMLEKTGSLFIMFMQRAGDVLK